jgi:hypothetical protein
MAGGVSRMSLPETEEFKPFQVSMEGQQESPGAHLHEGPKVA